MHMHGTHGTRMPKRTCLRRPLRAVERPEATAVGAAACPAMSDVEPKPLVATTTSSGPSVRVDWAVRAYTAT